MTALTVDSRAPITVDDDDAGYREFYARYHRPLLCYLQVAFADADVEGVAQETMCRALKHWSTVGQMKTPWPWLAVTARNLARNNIRDEKGTYAAGLQVFESSYPSHIDVAEQVDASDQLRRLAKAMEVLTPLQRQLLTVVVEEGLTGAQVARRLGMQPGAARMHLCRMRARLSQRFIALGGQLGVVPLAFVRFFTHGRRKGIGAQHAPVAAGSAILAWSVAVVGIGVVGIAPSHTAPQLSNTTLASSGVVHAPASPHASSAAAKSTAASTRPTRGAVQAQQPAVAYHLVVGAAPTKPGTVVEAGFVLQTPAGPVHATAPAAITPPEPGSRCPLVVSC